jgi:hypothetical protein
MKRVQGRPQGRTSGAGLRSHLTARRGPQGDAEHSHGPSRTARNGICPCRDILLGLTKRAWLLDRRSGEPDLPSATSGRASFAWMRTWGMGPVAGRHARKMGRSGSAPGGENTGIHWRYAHMSFTICYLGAVLLVFGALLTAAVLGERKSLNRTTGRCDRACPRASDSPPVDRLLAPALPPGQLHGRAPGLPAADACLRPHGRLRQGAG